jgi:hypothetical protein
VRCAKIKDSRSNQGAACSLCMEGELDPVGEGLRPAARNVERRRSTQKGGQHLIEEGDRLGHA